MRPTTLLVVDDEADFLESLSERLSLRGFDMYGASTGPAALAQLEEHREIDIVLLDLMLPGMDGIETLKLVKQRFPLVEVILLTGHASVETAVQGLKLGARDYLLKPSPLDRIVVKAQEAVACKRHIEKRLMEELTKPYSFKESRERIIARIKEEEEACP